MNIQSKPAPLQYARSEEGFLKDGLFKAAFEFGLMCGLSSAVMDYIVRFFVAENSEVEEMIPHWVIYIASVFATIWFASILMLAALWVNCLIKKRVHFAGLGRITLWALPFPVVDALYHLAPPELQSSPDLIAFSWMWIFIYPILASWWLCKGQR